jgi:hypothetical protein
VEDVVTLDEVIAKLTELKTKDNSVDLGNATVVVKCPVAQEECWLHAENFSVKQSEIKSDNFNLYILIEGGFGVIPLLPSVTLTFPAPTLWWRKL